MDDTDRIFVGIGIFLAILTGFAFWNYATCQPDKDCQAKYNQTYTFYQDNRGGMFCKEPSHEKNL